MSIAHPTSPWIRRTLQVLLGGGRHGPRPHDLAPRTPRRSAPQRRVPAPRHEALAIGLGCDHLGRSWGGRRHPGP